MIKKCAPKFQHFVWIFFPKKKRNEMIVIIIMTLCVCVWVVRYIRLSHVQSLLVLNAHEKSGRQHVQRRRARAVPASDVEVHRSCSAPFQSPPSSIHPPPLRRLYKYEKGGCCIGRFLQQQTHWSEKPFLLPLHIDVVVVIARAKAKIFFFFFFSNIRLLYPVRS